MKNIFIHTNSVTLRAASMLLMALLLACCTTDDLLAPAESDVAISFIRLDKNINGTRAEFSGESFGAQATLYRPVTATGTTYINDHKVSSQGTYWAGSNPYYWPTSGNMLFAAWTPYGDAYTPTLGQPANGETANGASYSWSNYVNNEDGTTDLMYADPYLADCAAHSNDGSPVPTKFNHALAKLTINMRASVVQSENTTWTITVNKVQIANIRKQGSATFAWNNGWQMPAGNVWTTAPAATANATVYGLNAADKPIDGTEGNEITLTTDNTTVRSDYIVIPQTLYTADATGYQQYITVEYTVVTTITVDKYDDATGEVEKDADGEIKTETKTLVNKYTVTKAFCDIPFDNNDGTDPAWRVNRHIVYNLILSPSDPIEFDPENIAWLSGGDIVTVPNTVTLHDGENGTVSIDGTTVADGSSVAVQSFNAVTLQATPATDYIFHSWVKTSNGEEVSTDNPYSFNSPYDLSLEAKFVPVGDNVTVIVNNGNLGTVTANGTTVTGGQADITPAAPNGTVTLVATPAENVALFKEWQDADGKMLSTEPTYTYRSTGEGGTVKAVFVQAYNVTVKSSNISYGVAGINAQYAGEQGITMLVAHGTSVTLIANARDGYVFEGWFLGDATKAESTLRNYTPTITAAAEYTAVFRAPVVTVAVGEGGSVSSSKGESQAGAGTRSFDAGGGVTLTATAGSGYLFDRWANTADGSLLGYYSSIGYSMSVDAEYTAAFAADQWGTTTFLAGLKTDEFGVLTSNNQYVTEFTINDEPIYTNNSAPTGLYVQIPTTVVVKSGEPVTFTWTMPSNAESAIYVTGYIDADIDGAFNTTAVTDGGEWIHSFGTYHARNDAVRNGTVTFTPPYGQKGLTVMRWRFDSSWNPEWDGSTEYIEADTPTKRMVYDIIIHIE